MGADNDRDAKLRKKLRDVEAERNRLRAVNVNIDATLEEALGLKLKPRKVDLRGDEVTENSQGQREKADPLNRMIHMTNSAAAQKGTLIEVAELKMKDPEGTEWSLSGLKFDGRPRTPVDPAIFGGGTTRLRPEQ